MPKTIIKKKILVIIPCFNEQENIRYLLKEIKTNKILANLDVLVVDDGSTDKTYAEAVKYVPCLRLSSNLGIGGAVQTGIRYAAQNGYTACIQLDGDGQHPPNQIEILVKEYNSNSANLIIGSRYLSVKSFESTFMRRLGSQIISGVIKLLYGKKIADPTSGFRLMDEKVIKMFAEFYPQDYPEPISNGLVLQKKLKVKEVSVRMQERKYGRSSIFGINTILYMIRVCCYLLIYKFKED